MRKQDAAGDYSLAVIVPVAAAEDQWPQFSEAVASLGPIIHVSRRSRPQQLDASTTWLSIDSDGRGAALNAGARAAEDATHLWFVHADSILPEAAASELAAAIRRNPQALHYFDLKFHDGPALMRINEFGVRMRCLLFNAPFGDQAICVPRSLHEKIGGFPERVAYGEDHLYVRAARRAGAACIRLPLAVATSARKYVNNGWFKVVCDHQVKCISQALADRTANPPD
ncbi:MAG: hypothetical protein OXC81_05930 [Betaproteobacteria bacterium]|nr:hypothetical protein [Betaproteobacteria bacterium]